MKNVVEVNGQFSRTIFDNKDGKSKSGQKIDGVKIFEADFKRLHESRKSIQEKIAEFNEELTVTAADGKAAIEKAQSAYEKKVEAIKKEINEKAIEHMKEVHDADIQMGEIDEAFNVDNYEEEIAELKAELEEFSDRYDEKKEKESATFDELKVEFEEKIAEIREEFALKAKELLISRKAQFRARKGVDELIVQKRADFQRMLAIPGFYPETLRKKIRKDLSLTYATV